MGLAAVDLHKGIFGWCANSPKGSQPLNCRTTRWTRWHWYYLPGGALYRPHGRWGLRACGRFIVLLGDGGFLSFQGGGLAIEHFGH